MSADKELLTFRTVLSSPSVSTSKINAIFRNVDQSTRRDVTGYTNFQQHRCDGLKSRVEPCCGPQADSHSEHKLSFHFKVPRNIKKMNKSKTGRPVTVRRLTVNCSGPADGVHLQAIQHAACITPVSEKLPQRRGELRQKHELTAGNSVLFEKLTFPQLFK